MRIGPDLLAMAIGSGEKSSMSKVEAVDDDCDDFKLIIKLMMMIIVEL